jgi:ribonuclease HII
VSVGPRRIETLNIREASRLAMKLAAERICNQLPSQALLHLLIDGNVPIETLHSQETIIKGDEKIMEIQAASILAKVTRDRIMKNLEVYYPGYEFATHKGYPTKVHSECIKSIGPCKIHRRTFAGVREYNR